MHAFQSLLAWHAHIRCASTADVVQGVDRFLLGKGLSNLQYAYLAEAMGRVPWASEVFNCSAPDTGHLLSNPFSRLMFCVVTQLQNFSGIPFSVVSCNVETDKKHVQLHCYYKSNC